MKSLRFLPLLLLLSLFAASCGQKTTDDKKYVPVADTTEMGKKIAAVSVKIGESPNNPELYHERALLHMQREDVNNALIDVVKAIEIDSTKATYFITLSDVYFSTGKAGKSKAALEKALSIEPTNEDALEKLAELYFYARQYDQTMALLDKVLKTNINHPKAYFMKGMTYKEKGDTAKAISSFQTAIEQLPNYYDAYMQQGVIYTAQNNPLALQYFEGALRLHPKSEEALYGRGMFYQEVKHDYDKAIQDYTAIIQINPANAAAHFALGYIHFQYLKVYDEAVKHYSRALDANPEYAEAAFNRGLSYESMGNISAAKNDYQLALKIRPDYPLAKAGLARVSR